MTPLMTKGTRRRCGPQGRWLIPGLALVFITLIGPAGAEEDAIELSADNAEVRDAEGISIYRGSVVLTRGDQRITGDLMRVFNDDERQLERIEVEGTPATYREALPEAPTRRAEAPRMEYFASGPERLILRGGGRLWQADNEVTGSVITHYPGEARTIAEGDEGGGERVNVTVYPEDDDTP